MEELQIKVLPEPGIELDPHVKIIQHRAQNIVSFKSMIRQFLTHH
jgi:hypothetical protein